MMPAGRQAQTSYGDTGMRGSTLLKQVYTCQLPFCPGLQNIFHIEAFKGLRLAILSQTV